MVTHRGVRRIRVDTRGKQRVDIVVTAPLGGIQQPLLRLYTHRGGGGGRTVHERPRQGQVWDGGLQRSASHSSTRGTRGLSRYPPCILEQLNNIGLALVARIVESGLAAGAPGLKACSMLQQCLRRLGVPVHRGIDERRESKL